MTIRKGDEWGRRARRPQELEILSGDAEFGERFAAARAIGQPFVFVPGRGDLSRALGLDAARRASGGNGRAIRPE